jgi:signal transduction histidine kinase
MDNISTLFTANHEAIYFAYGLVFFVLGLAIALQSRTYSRLDIARSLSWLSAFGFAHAFYEWGDLFIPIQAPHINPTLFRFLHDVHLLLLALSFTFLFEFGVALLNPLGRARWLHGVSGAVLATWIFVVYFPLASTISDFQTWHNMANALARYFIGLPAGLVAGYGLRQHTFQRIVPLNVPHIVKMLQYAGILLLIYAVLSGLIPPPVPFFPGNVVNSTTFMQFFKVPPAVFTSLLGLGLVVAMIRALEVFDVETARMIESMEQQQILTAERDRIARDLHDGAIQKVYTAGLLIESAQKMADSDPLSTRLEKAVDVLNDAISDLRHNLSELYSSPQEEPFPVAMKKLVDDPRFRSLVDISLDLELPDNHSLSPPRTDHVLAIVNESLSNAVRHARARRVKITARSLDGHLRVAVEDDGIGIPVNVEAGYGLRNMHDRAHLLGGEVNVNALNGGGKGTRVTLDIPWVDER